MPNDNRTLVYRAQIESLTFAATTAIRTRDAGAFITASRQLSALTEDIDVPSALRDVASRVQRQLAQDMTDEGLRAMTESIAGLAGAAGELQGAIELVKRGQSHLFFPALADAAANALEKFNDLKVAAKGVEDAGINLRNATGAQLGGLPDKLRALLASLENLRTTADA